MEGWEKASARDYATESICDVYNHHGSQRRDAEIPGLRCSTRRATVFVGSHLESDADEVGGQVFDNLVCICWLYPFLVFSHENSLVRFRHADAVGLIDAFSVGGEAQMERQSAASKYGQQALVQT